jgi:hypothetical protein
MDTCHKLSQGSGCFVGWDDVGAEEVGRFVGEAVLIDVGAGEIGFFVGEAVATVGEDVTGLLDGEDVVGCLVGAVVGGLDGLGVGFFVGSLLGLGVGSLVGGFDPALRQVASTSHGNLQHSSRVS